MISEVMPQAEQERKPQSATKIRKRIRDVMFGSLLLTISVTSGVHAETNRPLPPPIKPDVPSNLNIDGFDVTKPPPFLTRVPITGAAGVSQGPESTDYRDGETCEYNPYTHKSKFATQESIDLSSEALYGQPVVTPVKVARVAYAGPSERAPSNIFIPNNPIDLKGAYGKLVVLQIGEMQLFFAHLSEINVQEGEVVREGDQLGKIGKSGTNKVHLHMDLRELNEDGRIVTVPIRTLFMWTSDDITQTCIDGERYDALALGPELARKIAEAPESFARFEAKNLSEKMLKALAGMGNTGQQKPSQRILNGKMVRPV